MKKEQLISILENTFHNETGIKPDFSELDISNITIKKEYKSEINDLTNEEEDKFESSHITIRDWYNRKTREKMSHIELGREVGPDFDSGWYLILN